MKNSTQITILLDRSGSMSLNQTETVEGFNEFIKDQQKVEGETSVTLIQFADEMVYCYNNKPVKEVFLLKGVGKGFGYQNNFIKRSSVNEYQTTNTTEYYPNGISTSLRDVLGQAIFTTGKNLASLEENQRPDKVVFVIITDGQDNSSVSYSLDKVKEMIDHQQKVYNWTFLYLGADMNGVSEAKSMGININTIASYKGTQNIKSAYKSASLYTQSLRTAKTSIDSKIVSLQDLLDNA